MITELLYLNLTRFQLDANLIVLLLTKCVGWVWRLCEGSLQGDPSSRSLKFGKVGALQFHIFFLESSDLFVCTSEKPLGTLKREGIHVLNTFQRAASPSSSSSRMAPIRQGEAGRLLLPPLFLPSVVLIDWSQKYKDQDKDVCSFLGGNPTCKDRYIDALMN